MFDKIREDYRKNKGLFFLKSFIKMALIYFGIQLLFIVIDEFKSFRIDTYEPQPMTLLPFYMVFLSGVLSVIEMYEISFNQENKKFKSLRSNIIVSFFSSLLLLFAYITSQSLR